MYLRCPTLTQKQVSKNTVFWRLKIQKFGTSKVIKKNCAVVEQ